MSRLAPLIGVFFLAAFTSAQETQTPNYYPLDVGNEWNYRVTANDKKSGITTRISKLEELKQVKLARLESPSINMTEHLAQTDKGVFRHYFNGNEVSPPFKLLPYPATVGTKWEGEFTVQKEPGKHKYTGEIVKEEPVEVPAGKYTALRVVIKLAEGGKMIETSYWFVKDVGIVKQSFETTGLSITLELDKFDKKK